MYLIVLCCLYFLVYGNGKVLTGREGSRRAMRSKAFEQPSSASQASKTSTLTAKIADIQRSASASSSSSQSPDMWVDVDEDNFDPDPPLPVYFEPLSKPLPKQEALSAQSTSPPPATAQVHPDVELQEATPTRTPTRNPTFAPSLQPSGMTKPPPCLTDPSEIAYINDQISATQTLYYCLGNVGDSMLLPSIYNGTLNAIMMVYNNIQLNNLHSVSLLDSPKLFCC